MQNSLRDALSPNLTVSSRFLMRNPTFFIGKMIGCHNSPQKRPPELIFGAKFTARRAESEFDSFDLLFDAI